MCTNFRRPAQWTSSDAIGWEALQCREMQSHDENEMVNNCHATSTLYARKNKRNCYALSLVSSCLSKETRENKYILFYLLMDFILFIKVAFHAFKSKI